MRRTARRSLFSRPAALLTLAASLAFSGTALGADADDWSLSNEGFFNVGYMNMYKGPSLELASSQLERIADVLGLDETQRSEMMDLFAGLEDQHLRAWVDFAEASNDMQNLSTMTGGKFDWGEQQKKMEAISEGYEREQERLIQLMLDDLRLMVTPEQERRWSVLEREQRRMKTLTKYGCYAEEKYDLVSAVQSLDLDEDVEDRLAPMLEQYAADLDVALQQRNRQLEKVGELNEAYSEIQREQWSLDWSSPEAQQRYQEIQEQLDGKKNGVVEAALTARTYCRRVADVNKRFTQEVGDALPDRPRRELETMVATSEDKSDGGWDFSNYSRARQKFSMVLNMEEMIGAYSAFSGSMGAGKDWGIMRIARQMEPLTPVQVQQIEALRDEFEAEMEILETKRPTPKLPPEEMSKWRFTLRTPGGNVTLQHNDPPEEMGGKDGNVFMVRGGGAFTSFGEDEASDEMAAYNAERGELEQRYIEGLRELLTLRQRALIALN